MSVIVVEESVVSAITPGGLDRIHVVPRDRRRDGSWPALAADAVVAVLEAAGSEALVLARPPAADPGAAALSALAGMMEREVVRLPASARAAAWVVGVAMAGDEGSPPPLRALQALAGAADRLEHGPRPGRRAPDAGDPAGGAASVGPLRLAPLRPMRRRRPPRRPVRQVRRARGVAADMRRIRRVRGRPGRLWIALAGAAGLLAVAFTLRAAAQPGDGGWVVVARTDLPAATVIDADLSA